MKKVLFVSKLFSGFETSIKNREFRPTGAPTAYKIIEKLDREYNLKLILTSKNDLENKSLNFFKKINIKGLKKNILILGSFNSVSSKKINNLLREFAHLVCILYQLLVWRPNIVYLGNANIISAAFIAKFFRVKVIFRVMGVYESMRSYHYKNNFINKFYLWCYASKFDAIICTQDGSGVEDWLKKTININTNYHKLINGVDFINHEVSINSNDNRINIIFIGRLEKEKGILELLEVINYFYFQKRTDLKFTIVGTGLLENKLRSFIEKFDSDFVKYQTKIPHNEINKIYKDNDVYISLNKRGSLSNTMLEAISNNLCCICLTSNPLNGIDKFTDQFLDKNYFLRVDRNNIVNDLINIIKNLDKNKLLHIKKHTNIFANKNLNLWDKRVDEEFKIISELI